MNTRCVLEIHRTEEGYLFGIKGRGTMRESPTFRDFVCGAIGESADVVLDLSECEYLDSTFLGCLVILHRRAAANGGSFEVFAADGVCQGLLRSARLHEVLTFTPTRPKGIGDPITLPVSEIERPEFCRHLMEAHQSLADLGGPAAAAFRGIAEQLAKELDGST